MYLFGLVRRSRILTLAVSLLLLLVVGSLDLVTGSELNFSLFYLFPIALATWLSGKWTGIALSVTAAVVWLLADLWQAAYLHPLIPLWNTLVRLAFFLICTLFLFGLKEHRKLELEQALADRAAEEQHRIGQELHDTVMQQILGTKMLAGSLHKELKDHGAGGAAAAAELVSQLNEAAAQLRRLVSDMVAVQMGPDDLIPALDRVVRNFQHWHNLPVQLEYERAVSVRDGRIARHLVLLAQEALMNVTKHAQASGAVVQVETTPHDLRLRITDDGLGLPENHAKLGGLGLQSMRDRAELIGAALQLSRGDPCGTEVLCILTDYAPQKPDRGRAVDARAPQPMTAGREADTR